MTHPILNIADLDYRSWGNKPDAQRGGTPSERYEAKLGAISGRIGAQKLGYNLTVLPPGKSAFPRHSHHVNEEMFFIVEGNGEVRIGDRRYPIKRGDVIACPPGGPETAHQITNTAASGELKFLAVSTKLSPEIGEYPDSGKIGIFGEFNHKPGEKPYGVRFVTRAGESVDYWEGE
jgi:uncharacterized cupin superfamily protein